MTRDRHKGAEAPKQGFTNVLAGRTPKPASLPEGVEVKPAPAGLVYRQDFNRDEQMPARDQKTGELVMTARYVPLLKQLPEGGLAETGSFRDLAKGLAEVHPYPQPVTRPMKLAPTRPGRPRPTVVYANGSTPGSM